MRKVGNAVFGVLCVVSQIAGCDWDYDIWSKSRASDTALFRFVVDEDGSGFIDRNGKVVIPPQYLSFGNTEGDFLEGVKAVTQKGGGSFYIDAAGARLKQFDGMHLGTFSEGVATVSRGGQYGFVDHAGKFVIAAKFKAAREFQEGLAAVKVGDRYGYIDHSGALVIPATFAAAEGFSNGRALVVENGPCTFAGNGPCDAFNASVIPSAPGVRKRPTSSSPRCRYSVIDRQGKVVFTGPYTHARDFSEGLAAMSTGRYWGYLDSIGKVRIPLAYESAAQFSEGFAAVSRDGKAGFIDRNGTILVPLLFRSARDFSEGMAVVVDQLGKHMFVDKTGKRAIAADFDAASGFVMGLAHVRVGDTWSYINRTGKAVFTYSERGKKAQKPGLKPITRRH